MNIHELQSERDALQIRLRSIIQNELNKFTELTNVGVKSTYIDTVSYRNIGDKMSTYIVHAVNVDLDL